MKEGWKADVVRDLYLHEITRDELASEMGVSTSYINMVLSGARKGTSAEQKMVSALGALKKKKSAESDENRADGGV